MNTYVKKYSLVGTGIIIFFILGICIGLHIGNTDFINFLKEIKPIRNTIPGFIYTAPLLGLDSPPATEFGIYHSTRNGIGTLADKAKQEGFLSDYGIYYRELNTSLWFGINQDESFLPASLYKLPTAFIIYKEIEDGVLSENRTLVYTENLYIKNTQTPEILPSNLKVGSSYTIEKLVTEMLSNSDNGAKDLLGTVIKDKYVQQLWDLTNLGSPHPDETISVRDYSFFFRILYSSTYLNTTDSEKVLGMMALGNHDSKLVAGIPAEITVAHKWGLYNLDKEGQSGMIELHDCGIIYFPDNPYLLCVMTKGSSEQSLSQFIESVSKTVYDDHLKYEY